MRNQVFLFTLTLAFSFTSSGCMLSLLQSDDPEVVITSQFRTNGSGTVSFLNQENEPLDKVCASVQITCPGDELSPVSGPWCVHHLQPMEQRTVHIPRDVVVVMAALMHARGGGTFSQCTTSHVDIEYD